jgi:hypothetical protein
MRRSLLLFLLILTIGLSGCSFSADFVVVNEARYPIQVIYKLKWLPTGPQALEVEPRVISASNVEERDPTKWTKLNPNQYRIDQLNRTVTLTLHAHEALLVTRMHNYQGDGQRFPIEEISLLGSGGEMKFTGDKARQAFQSDSRVLFKLTYK